MAKDRLQAMMVFKRTAELGSFSKAAADLDMTPATASKYVAFLERYLGVRLIHRTTRSMHITDVGQNYLLQVQQLLEQLEMAEQEAAGAHIEPQGRIRLNVPMSFGVVKLPNIIDGFLKRYPRLEVDVQLTDGLVDLVAQGVDVALRMREKLDDSSLIAKPLMTTHSVLCASPSYIKQAPKLNKPSDLVHHNCITYSRHSRPSEWYLGGELITVSGNYRADNSLLIEQGLLRGVGIGLIPQSIIEDSLASGKLVALLPEYLGRQYTLYALFPQARRQPQRVRLLLDYLQQALA